MAEASTAYWWYYRITSDSDSHFLKSSGKTADQAS